MRSFWNSNLDRLSDITPWNRRRQHIRPNARHWPSIYRGIFSIKKNQNNHQ